MGPLTEAEATAWLGTGEQVGQARTLAELYALKAGREGFGTITTEPSTGQYL